MSDSTPNDQLLMARMLANRLLSLSYMEALDELGVLLRANPTMHELVKKVIAEIRGEAYPC